MNRLICLVCVAIMVGCGSRPQCIGSHFFTGVTDGFGELPFRLSEEVSLWACHGIFSRITAGTNDHPEPRRFTMWENKRYVFCELSNNIEERSVGPSTHAVQIRKEDGKWRYRFKDWRCGGYIHLHGSVVVAEIARIGNIKEIEAKFGPSFTNPDGVYFRSGETLPDGHTATNLVRIHNSNGYTVKRYECRNGFVDIVLLETNVVWSKESKGGSL